MALLAPACVPSPLLKGPAYVIPEAACAKFRGPRRRPAKAKKQGTPEADGQNLEQREEEARAWATVQGIRGPASLEEAVKLYAECRADKKHMRIFIAQLLVADDCLRMNDQAKKHLLCELKNELLRAGAERASDDYAALMLAFSQRVGRTWHRSTNKGSGLHVAL